MITIDHTGTVTDDLDAGYTYPTTDGTDDPTGHPYPTMDHEFMDNDEYHLALSIADDVDGYQDIINEAALRARLNVTTF